jgi:hypothetical protein
VCFGEASCFLFVFLFNSPLTFLYRLKLASECAFSGVLVGSRFQPRQTKRYWQASLAEVFSFDLVIGMRLEGLPFGFAVLAG